MRYDLQDLRAALRRTAFTLAAGSAAGLVLVGNAAAQPERGPDPGGDTQREAQTERSESQPDIGDAQADRAESQTDRSESQTDAGDAQADRAESQADRAESEREAEADRGDGSSALERAQSELERARRELEAAAREVARLSAEAVGPYVDDLRRDWFDAGQRATLGIGIEDADIGVRVTAVSPGGPAEEAGIRTGDVITAIDGAELVAETPAPAGDSSPSRLLIAELANVTPGESVVLRVVRDNQPRDVTVETSERRLFSFNRPFSFEIPRLPQPAMPPFFGNFRAFGRWGDMELVTLSPELGEYFGTGEGLLVVRAPDDDALPLRAGDVILAIGDRTPTSPEHALRILASFEPGETLRLTIMRRQMRETLEVRLPAEGDGRNAPDGGDTASLRPLAPRGGAPSNPVLRL